MRTRDFKARAEELAEGYQDARDEEFYNQFMDMFCTTPEYFCDNKILTISELTEDDVQGFLDSFNFPYESDWAANAVQNELDDIGDQRYEEERDRRI